MCDTPQLSMHSMLLVLNPIWKNGFYYMDSLACIENRRYVETLISLSKIKSGAKPSYG